jgi:hypothetical protein
MRPRLDKPVRTPAAAWPARLDSGDRTRVGPALVVPAGWVGHHREQHRDLPREKLRDLLIAAFGATLLAAQHIDPKVKIELT